MSDKLVVQPLPQAFDLETLSNAELSERRWGYAIEEWLSGRPEFAKAEINNLSVPDFVREFLSDLVMDTVKHTTGRPTEYDEKTKRRYVNQVFAEWDQLKEQSAPDPKATAIATIAERNRMKDGALRNIVAEMKKCGWTLEFWRKNIKPNYKQEQKSR